jgi:hypothetical protein
VVSREADILKGPRPATARISESSIFEIAGDDSLAGEGSAEVTNMLQVISGLPETAMDYEQDWEGSRAVRYAQLGKMLRTLAVLDTFMKGWWRPV